MAAEAARSGTLKTTKSRDATVAAHRPQPLHSDRRRPHLRRAYDADAHRFTANLNLPSSLSSGKYQLVVNAYDTAIPANLNTTGQETLTIKR